MDGRNDRGQERHSHLSDRECGKTPTFKNKIKSIAFAATLTAALQKLAIENAEAIANTPGVDVLMVGVGDLKSTLGIPIRNPDGLVDESKFHEAMTSLAATAKKTGVQLMLPAFRLNPGDAESLRHFKMILTSVDIMSVAKYHRLDLARMKDAMRQEHAAASARQESVLQKGGEELELQDEQKDECRADSGTEL